MHALSICGPGSDNVMAHLYVASMQCAGKRCSAAPCEGDSS